MNDLTPEQRAIAQRAFTVIEAAGFAPFKVAENAMFGALAQAYMERAPIDGAAADVALVRAVTNLDIFAGGAYRSRIPQGMTGAMQIKRN